MIRTSQDLNAERFIDGEPDLTSSIQRKRVNQSGWCSVLQLIYKAISFTINTMYGLI